MAKRTSCFSAPPLTIIGFSRSINPLRTQNAAARMTTIGPVIEKQQKIVNDCVEKKLSLSKLQSSIWEKSNNNVESFTLSDLDDDLIQNLIDKDVSNEEQSYKLK
jgi:hypothetical protein